MYPSVRSDVPLAGARGPSLARGRWPTVSRNVVFLGLTSLFTDISSEMLTAVLPLYFMLELRMTPLQFGLIDGLYQGTGDRPRRQRLGGRRRHTLQGRRDDWIRPVGGVQGRPAGGWRRVDADHRADDARSTRQGYSDGPPGCAHHIEQRLEAPWRGIRRAPGAGYDWGDDRTVAGVRGARGCARSLRRCVRHQLRRRHHRPGHHLAVREQPAAR